MTGRSRYLAGCGLAIGVLLGGSLAQGRQIELLPAVAGRFQPFVPQAQPAPTEQTQDGFNVAASGTAIEDTPAGEAIKLIEEGQWIKAIQAIETLNDTDQQLIMDANGVLRPLSAMKSTLIASMPEAGRRTFSKLNDPAANTKLAEALGTNEIDEREQSLKSIVDSYASCDAAAVAAEHLGDIRFEQGRFNEAAAHYRFASEHPATTADDAGLMIRRLTALSRAEQWVAFDALAEYAKFRHPQAAVMIAGQDTPIQGFIAALAAERGAVPDQPGGASPTRLILPDASKFELEYDQRLIAEDDLKSLKIHAQNHNVSSVIDQVIAPVVASDGQRLFTLALGQVTRLNPETGTELWRFGDTKKVLKPLQQRIRYLTSGYHQSLTAHGDTLLVTIPQSNNTPQSHLFALDAETGQEKWNLSNVLRSNNEGVVGTPLVIGEQIYFVTYKTTLALTLHAVDLNSGLKVSTLALGKASKGPRMNAPAELSPRLTMGQSHLLVQTNNGALIAVDPNEMKIAWAFTQKIRPSSLARTPRHRETIKSISRHTGDVVADDGLVFTKDTRTNRAVAFREYDAAMLWQAEADADATIVHFDDRHVYVLGKELVALDRRTGEAVWWTPHPGDKSGQPVFTDDACLIAGNTRFCRIDLATGKLTHYREDMIDIASLHLVGNQLISVAQNRITAITLP